jgi:glycosyltransferase involved in cell wall biosynthesis
MALPIVATSVPGCVDAVEDGVTGTLVPARDAGLLANALQRYLHDAALRATHGEAARRRAVGEFRREAIWHAVAAEYRGLLETAAVVARDGTGEPGRLRSVDGAPPPAARASRRWREDREKGGDGSPARRSLRVVHVITGLGTGGAEAMLQKLVAATRAELSHSVVSLTGSGPIGSMLAADGVPVTCLGMRRGTPDPRAIGAIVRLLRRERPDVVQSWMYHADLLAGLAGALAGRIPVVWGIRHTDADPATAKRLTHWTRMACARLSGVLPARIVCCADSARDAHCGVGYRADRMLVIPNGFDLTRFAAQPGARARVRRELDIPDEAGVVGMVARFHPDKDHRNFVAAARVVGEANRGAVFVLAGQGVDGANPTLSTWIDANGLRSRVRLLGVRSDVPSVLAAMDVLATSSRTEAFPNVLGEAMASGIPCVATDCGDSRAIVGATGRVVPPGDPVALGRAILEVLGLPPLTRAALGAAARERICERYDIRVIARRYVSVYESVSGRGVRSRDATGEGGSDIARAP